MRITKVMRIIGFMYTRCPKCSTCFRVTDRHLSIAKGKVRCGQCKHIFNAPEHAVDDLPLNQISGQDSNKPEIKTATKVSPPPRPYKAAETIGSVKKTEPAPVTEKPKVESNKPPQEKTSASANIKADEKPVSAEAAKNIQAPITDKAVDETPVFKADATMIADISVLESGEFNEVNLDTPSVIQDAIDEDDDLFDDSFDLNAAIDELTQATDDDEDIFTSEEEPKENIDNLPTDNNAEDIFKTDAYASTNAGSVAEVLNEMEGQLSLNIPEPEAEIDDDYDADDEFEFIDLGDDDTEIEEVELSHENNDDDFESINLEPEQPIDEDELFDQIDLTDLNESEHHEEIILEDFNKEPANTNVPFQLHNDIERLQASSQRQLHPVVKVFLIFILAVLSFSQLAYFRAHELVNFAPATRPLLEAFCEKLDCHYSGPRDTKQIQLISRDVRLHPKEKKALLISAAMLNKANFAQPYPDIHIRLSDISGNVVAERVFNAKTYMGKLSNPFLLMKSKTPVHINFEVVDPGKDAINFEFTFL